MQGDRSYMVCAGAIELGVVGWGSWQHSCLNSAGDMQGDRTYMVCAGAIKLGVVAWGRSRGHRSSLLQRVSVEVAVIG